MRATRSAIATLPEANGARAMFEGVAIMMLRDGKIAGYREVANTATGFEFCPRADCEDYRPARR